MTSKLTKAQKRALAYYAAGGDCLSKGAPRRDTVWALRTAGLLDVELGIRSRIIVVTITEKGRQAAQEEGI